MEFVLFRTVVVLQLRIFQRRVQLCTRLTHDWRSHGLQLTERLIMTCRLTTMTHNSLFTAPLFTTAVRLKYRCQKSNLTPCTHSTWRDQETEIKSAITFRALQSRVCVICSTSRFHHHHHHHYHFIHQEEKAKQHIHSEQLPFKNKAKNNNIKSATPSLRVVIGKHRNEENQSFQ